LVFPGCWATTLTSLELILCNVQ